MTQQKKYIWLRNIALLSICGFLCYSLFPVPPITWRLLFLGVVFFTIWPNLNKLTRLEKWIIAFWGLNLVYYFTSYFWLDSPSTTQIGNISVTLLSIPLFLTLSRRGVMTNKFYSYAIILLLLSAIVYYESLRVIMLAKFIHRDDITNNASVVFVYLLPFVLFLKKSITLSIESDFASFFKRATAFSPNIAVTCSSEFVERDSIILSAVKLSVL